MNCEETLALLDAYFDNELDLTKTLAIEEHLRNCASCRSQYELRVALRHRLKDPDLRYSTPHDFADQIRKKLAVSFHPTRKILSFRSAVWIPAAIAAAAIFGAFFYANIQRLLPAGPASMVAEVASDHIRSLIGTHLVDVESSDQHTVKPWFAGKLDFSPPVHDFADQGFKLVGGRLDYVKGKNVAVLIYRFKNHYVSLFMCRERNPDSDSRQKTFGYQGYNLVYWNANSLDCWVVSDAAPGALLEFVKTQQAEHSPQEEHS
ncbi:MAG TPA: zf-HC2 domain-containing protein [Chthoniobacterales bacterium]|nr:zf-HC2 domain-containing protein [Chthoniobacterales bacterium]